MAGRTSQRPAIETSSTLLPGWRVPQSEVVRTLDTGDPEVAGDVDPAGCGVHGVGVAAGAVVADAGQAAAERRPGGSRQVPLGHAAGGDSAGGAELAAGAERLVALADDLDQGWLLCRAH